MRMILAFLCIAALGVSSSPAQTKEAQGDLSQSFVVNPERRFVYLQFVRVGRGPQFNEGEPQTRIWFRLVNNSRIPIIVRTFGVPDGSAAEECGLMHEVVMNPALIGVVSDSSMRTNVGEPAKSEPAERMPMGYGGGVSSAATLGASEALLFSIPRNHLSDKWHIEIDFRFALTHKRPAHFDSTVGGEPLMKLSYFDYDLPPDVRKVGSLPH
jgi:hypothetical protein